MQHEDENDDKVKRFLVSFDPEMIQVLDAVRAKSGRLSRSAMLAYLVAQEARRLQLDTSTGLAPTPDPPLVYAA